MIAKNRLGFLTMATKTKRDWASRNAYYKARRRELKIKKDDKPRVCAKDGCGTILSKFNFNKCCHVHNFEYMKRNKLHLRLEELECF